jgi:hypothetical protein
MFILYILPKKHNCRGRGGGDLASKLFMSWRPRLEFYSLKNIANLWKIALGSVLCRQVVLMKWDNPLCYTSIELKKWPKFDCLASSEACFSRKWVWCCFAGLGRTLKRRMNGGLSGSRDAMRWSGIAVYGNQRTIRLHRKNRWDKVISRAFTCRFGYSCDSYCILTDDHVKMSKTNGIIISLSSNQSRKTKWTSTKNTMSQKQIHFYVEIWNSITNWKLNVDVFPSRRSTPKPKLPQRFFHPMRWPFYGKCPTLIVLAIVRVGRRLTMGINIGHFP